MWNSVTEIEVFAVAGARQSEHVYVGSIQAAIDEVSALTPDADSCHAMTCRRHPDEARSVRARNLVLGRGVECVAYESRAGCSLRSVAFCRRSDRSRPDGGSPVVLRNGG
jgi:hypothetical protein